MPLIQNPTTGRKLQRGFRLTELPDSILAPEIVGVVLLEDWSAPLSDLERGCMGGELQVAVAAEFGVIAIVRVGAPATYDLQVSGVWWSSNATGNIRLIVPTGGLAGFTISANTSFTDQNLPGRPSSQLIFDTAVGIPAGRNIIRTRALANTTYFFPLDIRIGTIGQGADLTSLAVVAETNNTDLNAGFYWKESAPEG